MLSARAFLLAGLLALCGILTLWFPSPAVELLFRLWLAGVVLACVADGILAARIRLRARRREQALLPLGREVDVSLDIEITPERAITLAVRTQLPPGLKTADQVLMLSHPGRTALTLQLAVRPVQLGEHAGINLPVRVLGPLGLTWWRHRIPLDDDWRVVPDPATRPLGATGGLAVGSRSSSTSGYGLELHQLRPYRPGDARRSVDWKASARASSLITRELTAERHQDVILMLDTGQASRLEIDGLARLGHFVNLASRLIRIAQHSDDQIGLIAYADQPVLVCAPVRAATGAHRLQRALASLASRRVESNPLLAMLRLQTLVRHRALIVLMTDLDEPAAATQLATALRLIARRHLPIVVDFETLAIGALATAAPVDWQDPYVALAAQEFSQGLRNNVERLTRIGCRVVLTRVNTGEEDLASAYLRVRAERRV